MQKIIVDPAQLEPRIISSLKAWHLPADDRRNSLDDLLLAQALGNEFEASNGRLQTNHILLKGIHELDRQNAQLAQILRLRFIETQKLLAVANIMAISEQTVSRLQKKAAFQLAMIIAQAESQERESRIHALEALLPPATYTKLFGVMESSQKLIALLEERQGPNIIAITGLGGIGKTALADFVVREMIGRFHFQQILWLRVEHQSLSGQSLNPKLTFENILSTLTEKLWPEIAEQLSSRQKLSMLRKRLNSEAHLVVIDNLESQSDAAYLLDQLHGFTNPTKFLLTSRSRLSEQSTLFNFYIAELSRAETHAFFRHHGQQCGIEAIGDVQEVDIDSIMALTGGNPLALKLAISLLDILPLSELLSDFKQSALKTIEAMYRHIYRQSWNTLTENGRTLLQAMPLLSDRGGTPAYLETVSGLAKRDLWPALHELRHRSLIEIRGTIHEKRYGIHRLTHSFLLTDIMNLPNW